MDIISQFDPCDQFILRLQAAKQNLNPDTITGEQALCILDEYERTHLLEPGVMEGVIIP